MRNARSSEDRVALSARDVARVAGVSVSTVSRALSRPDVVAPETLSKVLGTARALGYQPNRAARGLSTARHGVIGLVVPDIENPFFASVTKGVQARARAMGLAVMIADSDEDTAREAELAEQLSRHVDGSVLCSPRTPDSTLEQIASESTIVLVNRQCGSLPAVLIDQADGVQLALAHLWALGHRRIAYAGGPTSSWSSRARQVAVRAFISEHADAELVELGSFPPDVSGGLAAADLLIASGATAVLAYNDLVALGLIARLRRRGFDVPGDISAVGVDDIPMAALTSPPLTTVGVSLTACGRAAVDLLVHALRQPGLAQQPSFQDLSFRLVVRESTGPLARRPNPTAGERAADRSGSPSSPR